MDSTLLIPLIDALYNLFSAVDAKWAAIAGLVLLLMRAGVIRFPFSIPFLKPKSPAAPVPSVPDQPAPPAPALPADPADALRDLINKALERLRNRFHVTQAKALEAHAAAFLARLDDETLPLADPVIHSE